MNNKKTIIILILVLTIGIVGLTIAYFSNSTSVDNQFTTQPYGTTVEESFISPSNWLPGDITPKTIKATNSGNVDEAVRISFTEGWTPANSGSTLNGWIHADGTKSTHTSSEELANDERVAVINFDNTSDWTYNNGYYYYNYKLSPNETTSSLIKSVTFNSKTKLDDTCTETITSTGKTITCNSSGNDYDNATYNLVFTVETVQYNKYQEAWNTNVAIAQTKELKVKGLKVNADGAEYNTTTKSNMFKMTHPATEQTPGLTEYRYIGDNPNNYVYFNCDSLDNQSSSTCEVWRIIGVFDVDDGTGNYEQRIKIVRGSSFANRMKWDDRDSSSEGGCSICGKNEWNGSKLNNFLNGDYLTRQGDASTYGLKPLAQSQIGDAKYYLGGVTYNNGYGTTDAIYLWERGTEVYNQNSAVRSTSWVGKVALMYPSDEYLVYANGVENDCYNSPHTCGASWESVHGDSTLGWIYNSNNLEGQNSPYYTWFVSPYIADSYYVFIAYSDGNPSSGGPNNSFGVRPVAYLKSDIKITEGTGESTNPFKLGL